MQYLDEAEKAWNTEFGHIKFNFDEDKNLVSKTAWINGYVYGKTDLLLTLDKELQDLIENKKLHGIYKIEFCNGQLHGEKSR
jgi:hypothetical protein